jgi:hypothetical protein
LSQFDSDVIYGAFYSWVKTMKQFSSKRFTIGEKVKMLHDTNQGIVLQIYPTGRLLILIDDVLELEVGPEEIVSANIPQAGPSKQVQAAMRLTDAENPLQQAIYLAIEDQPNAPLYFHLINNLPYHIQYGVFQLQGDSQGRCKVSGQLDNAACQLLFSNRKDSLIEDEKLLFQFLFYSNETATLLKPQEKVFTLKIKHFQQAKSYNPYLKRDMIICPLIMMPNSQPIATVNGQQANINPIDPQTALLLEECLNTSKRIEREIVFNPAVQSRVDLHLAEILPNATDVDPATALHLQMQVFEKALNVAVANQQQAIFFIHGIGDGKLRQQIHAYLKKSPLAQKYELETVKGNMNPGVTKVTLK